MLIIINGPPGVGKTTISKEVIKKLHDCIYIDGDAILNAIVYNNTTREELSITLENIITLIKNFNSVGYKNFVVDFVFEKKEEINCLRRLAELLKINFFSCYLFASLEIICERNSKRKEEDIIDEARIEELYKIFESDGNSLGKKIWIQGKSIHTVVDEVIKLCLVQGENDV